LETIRSPPDTTQGAARATAGTAHTPSAVRSGRILIAAILSAMSWQDALELQGE
jgi:hypothetical protein